MLIGPGAGASDQAIDIENDCVLVRCFSLQRGPVLSFIEILIKMHVHELGYDFNVVIMLF